MELLIVVESVEFALERAFQMAKSSNPATFAALRDAARAYADDAAARHEPPTRYVEEVTRIARRAGVVRSAGDQRLGQALAWCAERSAERAGVTNANARATETATEDDRAAMRRAVA